MANLWGRLREAPDVETPEDYQTEYFAKALDHLIGDGPIPPQPSDPSETEPSLVPATSPIDWFGGAVMPAAASGSRYAAETSRLLQGRGAPNVNKLLRLQKRGHPWGQAVREAIELRERDVAREPLRKSIWKKEIDKRLDKNLQRVDELSNTLYDAGLTPKPVGEAENKVLNELFNEEGSVEKFMVKQTTRKAIDRELPHAMRDRAVRKYSPFEINEVLDMPDLKLRFPSAQKDKELNERFLELLTRLEKYYGKR